MEQDDRTFRVKLGEHLRRTNFSEVPRKYRRTVEEQPWGNGHSCGVQLTPLPDGLLHKIDRWSHRALTWQSVHPVSWSWIRWSLLGWLVFANSTVCMCFFNQGRNLLPETSIADVPSDTGEDNSGCGVGFTCLTHWNHLVLLVATWPSTPLLPFYVLLWFPFSYSTHYPMPIGIIPVITHTASDDMVLYALTTRIAMIRNVLFSFIWFRFVYSAVAQAGLPYLKSEYASYYCLVQWYLAWF